LVLAGGQGVEWVVFAASADHERNDLRVKRRSAIRDATHGIGEGLDVGDAILEQIANAACVLADEVKRVGLVAKLREHEDPGVRVGAPNLDGRSQPIIGVVRRHLHIHDGDVRPVRGHLAARVVSIG
jgi:hypothetical protein